MSVKNTTKHFRAKLVELFSRSIELRETNNQIYYNGQDNDYPDRVERIINNSVTAKLAANKMIEYIVGKGFKNQMNDFVVNKSKNTTLYKVLTQISRSTVYQTSFCIHINYDFEGNPNQIEVIPSKKVRISQEDSYGQNGKVWVSDDWGKESDSKLRRRKNKSNSKDSSLKWYYPYNPNLDIINAQRSNDLSISDVDEEKLTNEQMAELLIRNYRGQVLFFNPEDEMIYPNSRVDAVYNDADTEYRISVFRNDQVRNKFIGASVVTIEQQPEDRPIITEAQIKGLLGEDEAGRILLLEAARNEDGSLKEAIKVDTIKSEVDTERFKNDEIIVQENILNSFNNIPKILVKNSDASVFGASGESLLVSEKIYQRNTQRERQTIEIVLNKVLSGFPGIETNLIIDTLISEEDIESVQTEGTDDLTVKSQANLRGSVGGVTSLLAIQQSVAAGTTELSSGIAMLENIYGYTKDVAIEMLGNPEPLTEPPQTSL